MNLAKIKQKLLNGLRYIFFHKKKNVNFFILSDTAKLTMSVLSRFCLNMAANVGYQYAAELLPTPVRAQGIALIHIFGICAHSIAPYIPDTVSIKN